MLNIYVADNYHHKNHPFLISFINKFHNQVNNIKDANVILSASTKFNIQNFPEKKFIFGPHFGKERIHEMKSINNKYHNAIYIQPSQPSVDLWLKELNFNTMPVKAIPFGVNTEKFKSNSNPRTKIVLYYKDRNPAEFNFLQIFLKKNKIKCKIFNYKIRYTEKDYLSYLKECKYGIWLGRHESQGFALEEALSCNVPLLVWNVTQREQEWSNRERLKHIRSPVTTIPYWDERCGEYFYKPEELENAFNKFINKLDTYKPREFIIDNVSMEACYKKWNELINL